MINTHKHFIFTFIFAIILFPIMMITPSFAADEAENCVLCHRHEGLRVADDNEKARSFYVNYTDYQISIHKAAQCRGCHTEITEVPHKKNDKKVNCGVICHIKKGTYMGGSSHRTIYDSFMVGEHGIVNEDNPNCLYCHPQNFKENSPKKSRLEILAECVTCHSDDVKMSKYGISANVVGSYTDSVHSKIFFLEQGVGAICTDCHSVHNISKKEVETSPINEKNIYKTCAGSETIIKGCHLASNPNFIYSFKHEKGKEATVSKMSKLNICINYFIVGIFYFFCIFNMIRIIRE